MKAGCELSITEDGRKAGTNLKKCPSKKKQCYPNKVK